MEKANEIDEGRDRAEAAPSEGGGLGRILPRAFMLGWVTGLLALGSGDSRAALGAMAGALAAGVYVATYLGSHLSGISERTKIFEPRIARSALLRMALTAAGALASFLAGRVVLVSYLLSFAVAFLVLLVMEIPAARRVLRERLSE